MGRRRAAQALAALAAALIPHTLFQLNQAEKREEYDEPDFALIDTLFSLAEAHLYMQARGAV